MQNRPTPALEQKTDKKPHYVFHFDVNGTIMPGDTANGKTSDSAIWQMISEKYCAKWTSDTPEMTFRQYMEKYLCPGDPKKDKTLKARRQNAYMHFPQFLHEHHHETLREKALEDFAKIKASCANGMLFQSFVNFIHYLENQQDFDYSIVLRTFGQDLKEAVDEIEAKTSLTLDAHHGTFKNGELVTQETICKSPKEMHEWFKQYKFSTTQDEYAHWAQHGEKADYGKIFPVADKYTDDMSIFFDDNATKNIVSAAPLYGEGIDQKKMYSMLFRKGLLVNANAFEAGTNDNYFLERFAYALQQKNNPYFQNATHPLLTCKMEMQEEEQLSMREAKRCKTMV